MRIVPARPDATLITRSLSRTGAAPAVPLALAGDTFVPQDRRITFSLRAAGTMRFAATDRVEVEAGETGATAQLPLQLQDDRVAIATLDPAQALGPAARGPLRYRLVRGTAAGDWHPLATLVRLPQMSAVTCPAGAARCTLTGTGLFLLTRIAGLADTPVPDGFTGTSLAIAPPADGAWQLHLRDAPGAVATLAAP